MIQYIYHELNLMSSRQIAFLADGKDSSDNSTSPEIRGAPAVPFEELLDQNGIALPGSGELASGGGVRGWVDRGGEVTFL